MRHYECICRQCGRIAQVAFPLDSYPEYGVDFMSECPVCKTITLHTRTLTKKTQAALRRRQLEDDLRTEIANKCHSYGFAYKFWYRSVVITTDLGDWMFDYHNSMITLYHESTYKVNLETGDHANYHKQFENIKMTPEQVIMYIASHEKKSGRRNT